MTVKMTNPDDNPDGCVPEFSTGFLAKFITSQILRVYWLSAVTGVSFFLRACPSKFFHSSVQYHNFFTVVSQHVFHSCGCVPCTMFFMGVFQLPCTTFSTSVPACFLRVCFMHHVFLRVSQHVFFGCPSMFFSGVPTCFFGCPNMFFSGVPACFLRVCP